MSFGFRSLSGEKVGTHGGMATVFQGLKQHLPTMLSRWSLGPVSGKAQIPTSVTDVEKAIHNGIKCTRYRWFNLMSLCPE